MQNGIYHTNPPPRRAHLSYDAITQIEDILGHNFNQNSYPELWLAFTSAGNHWLAQTGESVLFLVLARCIGEFEEDDELYGNEVILWISQLISAAHVRTRETEQLAPFLTLPGRSTTGPSDEQLRMMTWALIAAVWNDTNRDIEAVTNVIRNLAIFDEISLHPTEDIFPL